MRPCSCHKKAALAAVTAWHLSLQSHPCHTWCATGGLAVAGLKVSVVQVREFQAVIGRETRQQCMEQFGGKPDICLACVGGGSNAMGGSP